MFKWIFKRRENNKPPPIYYIIKFGGTAVAAYFLLHIMSIWAYLLIGFIYCSIAHLLWIRWVMKTYSMPIEEWAIRVLIVSDPKKAKQIICSHDTFVVVWMVRIVFVFLPPFVATTFWPGELLHDLLGEISPKLKHPYLREKHPDIAGAPK